MAPSSSCNSNPRVMNQPIMKSQNDLGLRCPRCDSSNTKFCYYNNYSLSQPRHFCKACKRYWTKGGTLRNVPVGGCCRKNKRIKRTTTPTVDRRHGHSSHHLKGNTDTTNTVSSDLPSLPPLNSTSSLSSTTTTRRSLQNSAFLSPQLHLNSSLVSSLKSVLPSPVGFPAKEGDLDYSFLRDGLNGFNNTISLSSASSLLIPAVFPYLDESPDGLSSHIASGIIPSNQWRPSQVQSENFPVQLDELGNGVDTQLPKMTEENIRNFSVKLGDHECNRSGLQVEWQGSNLNGFGTINNEQSMYCNETCPDIMDYCSTVASLI